MKSKKLPQIHKFIYQRKYLDICIGCFRNTIFLLRGISIVKTAKLTKYFTYNFSKLQKVFNNVRHHDMKEVPPYKTYL